MGEIIIHKYISEPETERERDDCQFVMDLHRDAHTSMALIPTRKWNPEGTCRHHFIVSGKVTIKNELWMKIAGWVQHTSVSRKSIKNETLSSLSSLSPIRLTIDVSAAGETVNNINEMKSLLIVVESIERCVCVAVESALSNFDLANK